MRSDHGRSRRMAPQTYFILMKNGRLALAVGAALEERLLRDGHCAVALVLASGGLGSAGAGPDVRWCQAESGGAPQVVALYEDGLLERLDALGLAAYVGVPPEEQWGVVHWDNGAGAILLPVASARDLVDAVADRTPWSDYAVEPADADGEQECEDADDAAGREVAWLRRADAPWPGLRWRPGLSRGLLIAGVACPLLAVGL